MITSIISRIVILFFGTLYPSYASYKAVRTKNVKEYVKWMMYWIVFALFSCIETFTDIFLSWFPFYYELKIIIVLWLLSPATKGSSTLYRKFVHPMLTKHEHDIDEYISRAKDRGYSTFIELGTKGVNYATSVIMQTAIKSINGIPTILSDVSKNNQINQNHYNNNNNHNQINNHNNRHIVSHDVIDNGVHQYNEYDDDYDNNVAVYDNNVADFDNNMASYDLTRRSVTPHLLNMNDFESNLADNYDEDNPMNNNINNYNNNINDNGSTSNSDRVLRSRKSKVKKAPGGGNLVSTLRRSYSLSDLSESNMISNINNNNSCSNLNEIGNLVKVQQQLQQQQQQQQQRSTITATTTTTRSRNSRSNSNGRKKMDVFFPAMDVDPVQQHHDENYDYVRSTEDISSGYSSAEANSAAAAAFTRTTSLTNASRSRLKPKKSEEKTLSSSFATLPRIKKTERILKTTKIKAMEK